MRLLLDVGNTRIKWATWADGTLQDADELVHRSDPETSVASLLDRCSLQPSQVLVSNVAGPDFNKVISAGVSSRWNQTVEFARSQSSAGSLRNGYQDFSQLGVDRWLTMLAAVHRYRKAICVVDVGTAVTVDQIDERGQHLGGIILPGLDLMRKALTGNTGDLERLAVFGATARQDEAQLLGQSTDAAIAKGAIAAIRAVIEECRASLLHGHSDPVLVITGGDAPRIIPHLRNSAEHHPSLVLEGLAIYGPD
jgi:type III pantothenate kinase